MIKFSVLNFCRIFGRFLLIRLKIVFPGTNRSFGKDLVQRVGLWYNIGFPFLGISLNTDIDD